MFMIMSLLYFTFHTCKKEKSKPTEKRTRFYDVWIKLSRRRNSLLEPAGT